MIINPKGLVAVLYRKEMLPDWFDKNDPGAVKPYWVIAATTMFDDHSDTIYIGTEDENRKWVSFEGEAYYFVSEIEKKGMRGEIVSFTASIKVNPPKE